MENSIEEDIKILEEFKTNGYNILLMKYGNRIKTNFKLEKAIEHILSDYKRVLKENEELKIIKSAIQTLQINSLEEEKHIVISKSSFLDGSYKHLLDDYIPVQKIKDKIEELKNNIDYLKQFKDWYEKDYTNEDIINNILEVLQELLERRE